MSLLWYLLVARVWGCVQVTCEQLDRYNCASLNDTIINVNSYGCSDRTCSIATFLPWQEEGSSNLLKCDAIVSTDSGTVADSVLCDAKPTNQLLANGDIYPTRCKSSADCLLQDGSYNACVCGLDGFQYCAPTMGAEVFHRLWELCDETGQIDAEDWEHYQLLLKFYVQYTSAPSCALSIFSEFVSLSAYSSAQTLLLALVWLSP